MRLLVKYTIVFFAIIFVAACGNEGTDSTHEEASLNEAQTSETSAQSTVEVPVNDQSSTNTPAQEAQPSQLAKNTVSKFSEPEKKKEGSVNQRFKDLATNKVKEKLTDEPGRVLSEIDQKYEKVELTPLQEHRTNKKDKVILEGSYTGMTADPAKMAEMAAKRNKQINQTITVDNSSDKTTDLIHSIWHSLISQYVSSSGAVIYSGFQSKQAELDAYLNELSKNPPQSTWSRNEIMAYWINAYNAFTVKLIVDNMPIKSIRDLDGGKVWDRKWIKIGGKTYSLNNIENDILRPKYKDARIHFAVNCAAKSCPPLFNRAWTSGNLDNYFEQQATAFINNPKFNKITRSKVEVSKIFEWYAADFGNLIDYLNKYSKVKIDKNAKVSYMEYDWGLNN